jgi:hypothetical protein
MKKERSRKREEKKAQHDAKHIARREKRTERKEKRRENKERLRKEKEQKRIEKRGGDIPAQLLQGLRNSPGSRTGNNSSSGIEYNSKCEICTKSAASAISSGNRNPRCTICAEAAEREATNQYLKSSKINKADLSSLENVRGTIKKLLGKKKKAIGGTTAGFQAQGDEELSQHIAQHVQHFAINGSEAALRRHICNDQGQPSHLARHGLDGNRDSLRDSPLMAVGRHIICRPYQRSWDLSSTSTPRGADWWVQALSSSESSSSTYRPSSPCFAPPRR